MIWVNRSEGNWNLFEFNDCCHVWVKAFPILFGWDYSNNDDDDYNFRESLNLKGISNLNPLIGLAIKLS